MKKLFSLFCSMLMACAVVAQTYQLTGRIVNNRQQLLQGVIVSLSGTTHSVETDSTGRFSFRNLLLQDYQLNATAEGYHTVSERVRITQDEASILITLHPLSRQLEEVLIIDNRINQRKQEEPMNIEIVGSDFIHRNLGGSLMQTLKRLPGVKSIGIGSGQSKPLIRGLGFNRVVVIEKGVKHEAQQWGADHGLEVDQFSAGEIELLKGAASFAYGSDAIGGVINIKPAVVPLANTFGGTADLIGKTNNNLYGSSVNLYGRNQKWFFDSRLTYQNYGDYRVPAEKVFVYDYEVKLNGQFLRNTAGRENAIHFNTGYLGNTFRTVFYLSNTYNKSGFFANAHGLEPRRVDTELHDRSGRDIQMPGQQVNHFKIINQTNYSFAAHQLQVEFGYQRNYRQEHSQYVNHGYMPAVYPNDLAIPKDLERQFDKHVVSVGIKDQFSIGKHEFTIGVNNEFQKNTIGGWSFLIPSFSQTILGAFAHDKLRLSEELLLHGALRFDHGRIRISKYIDWFASDISNERGSSSEQLIRANDLNRTFNSLVWSLGLNYNPNKFAFKLNIGKSFRMPIAKELAANGVNYHYFSYEQGNPQLSPEQSYQADLSLGWNEEKWSATLSPFYNYFSNYIYLNPTSEHDYYYGAGNQVFEYTQSRVMRYGGELRFTYKLLQNLTTELLGEYLYARQLSGSKEGYTLPFSTPASVLFNLSYTPAINTQFVKETYFSIDYRITGSQNQIVPPEKKTPGYSHLNLGAGSKVHLFLQPVSISLQIQNLLDTKYLNHTSFYRLIELPEAGRNIILSMKIPFNLKRNN